MQPPFAHHAVDATTLVSVDIQTLIANAQKGEFSPVHLLSGSERFFVDRAVAALRHAAVGVGDAWNEQTFQGKGQTASAILEAARTLPMMARVRFVLVRNVDQLAPNEQDKLAAYIKDPADSACLVLLADKLDGRSRLAKTAKEQGVFTDAEPLKQNALLGFVNIEAKTRGLLLDPRAAAALVDAIGSDLPAIDDALERLSLYVGDGARITEQAVDVCVSRVRVESIWALVDAVSQRDRRTALRATASLLSDREPALRILAMVARQLRMVARMGDALQSGMSPPDAAKAAGAPPFKARDLATAAKRFGRADLGRAFAVLAATDLALKGSRRPHDAILEGAILELTAARVS